MSIAIKQTIHVLQIIVQTVPIGTNLALLQLMWVIINGSLLSSRGALFPALKANGFDEPESRRIWAALRYGVWRIDEMINLWCDYVKKEQKWQSHSYEGYRPVAVDWTAIWRPKLEGWSGKLFNSFVSRAIKGVAFGLVCHVGQVEGQRIPLLSKIIRADGRDKSEATLKKTTLKWMRHHLDEDEVVVVDAGVELSELHQLNMPRYVVRLASNCTARRDDLPDYKGRGCYPKWGDKVRPLPRTHLEKEIEATPPDKITTIAIGEYKVLVYGWSQLVTASCKPHESSHLFNIWVFFHPAYEQPLVLGTNLTAVSPHTIYHLYLDRWSVEQIPLVAKQMLGAHRQFVFAPQSCFRLPELAFLLGNVLTYLATVLPPLPTGFWDRHPKKHQGGFVALYLALNFLKRLYLTQGFVKKPQLRLIYPRVWRLIAVKKHHLNDSHQCVTVLQPIF